MKNKPDYIFLGVSLFLIVFGVLILASVSAALGQEQFGDVYYFLRRQLLFGVIPGLILGFLAFKIPLAFIKKWALPLLLANLVLLGLVFVPHIGFSSGGATRWLNFGFFSIQPSEFFKLSFFIYLAAWLAKKERKYKNLAETFIPFLIIIGIAAFLIYKQPNISTLGILIVSSMIMYFCAGTPLWHLGLIASVGVAGLVFLIKTAPYRLHRFQALLDSSFDPMGLGYQIKQALIAVGSGGIIGLGLGMSRQKFGFLPEPVGDSIFAVFSEETGFIGAVILIAIFLLFAWRGFKIIKTAPDRFSSLLALGITSWIIIQAFVNIGAMIGILPLTGIPMPFISYGGSHITAELIALGILFNISRNSKN